MFAQTWGERAHWQNLDCAGLLRVNPRGCWSQKSGSRGPEERREGGRRVGVDLALVGRGQGRRGSLWGSLMERIPKAEIGLSLLHLGADGCRILQALSSHGKRERQRKPGVLPAALSKGSASRLRESPVVFMPPPSHPALPQNGCTDGNESPRAFILIASDSVLSFMPSTSGTTCAKRLSSRKLLDSIARAGEHFRD